MRRATGGHGGDPATVFEPNPGEQFGEQIERNPGALRDKNPVNVLDLPSEDVAIALGHTDGGELVRHLYGHREDERALDRVTAAYGRTASFTQMQLVGARIPSPTADTLLR
jgi:hypothetical protein